MKRLLILLAGSTLLAPSAHAQNPGQLDPSFGGTGMVHLGFGFAHDNGSDMVRQSDGKIVMAGYAYNGDRREVVLVRYNTDGSLDPTFDGDGKVITSITYSFFASNVAEDLGIAVDLQTDGKIVVAGISRAGPGGGNDFLVLRYNTNGSLDGSFNGSGWVITDFGGGDDQANDVEVQPDGKIVVVGSASVGGDGKYAIARYDTNGALDPTFGGGDGIVLEGNLVLDAAYGMAIQPDGKIVAVGFSFDMAGDKISLLRVDSSGTPDPTFDGDGWVYTETSATAEGLYAVTLQPDPPSPPRIVVTGVSGTSMIVMRYLTNGVPDNSFDADGRVLVANCEIGGQDVAVITSGETVTHIVACGSITVALQSRFGAARFLPNGTPDATFDGDGVVTTAIGASAGPSALLLDSNKLILGGSSGASQDGDFTMARYDNVGVLDPTFDGDGIRVDALGNSPANARGMALQADGKIVLAGNVNEVQSSITRIGVMRLLTNGSPDPTFNGKGTVTTDIAPGSEIVGGVAVQPDGKIVVAGTQSADALHSNIAVVRYLPGGALDPDFASFGIQLIHINQLDRAMAVALQDDGKIVVAGWTSDLTNNDVLVMRLTDEGDLDPTFNGTGIIVYSLSSYGDLASAVAVQPDGKIVLVGEYFTGTPGDLNAFMLRFYDSGAVENAWDIEMSTDNDGATSVVLQPDGKILIGGWRMGDEGMEIAMARLTTGGTPDPTFDGDGLVFDPIGNGDSRANAVGVDADGRILAIGYGYNADFLHREFAVARYNADGSPDALFMPGGHENFYDFVFLSEDVGAALSIDSSGRILVAGSASGLFGVLRLYGTSSPVDVPGPTPPIPSRIQIAGANPFSSAAQVAFHLTEAGPIRLEVFDVSGAHVRTLADGNWSAGPHVVEWEGKDATGRTANAGVYFLRLSIGQERFTTKAIKID